MTIACIVPCRPAARAAIAALAAGLLGAAVAVVVTTGAGWAWIAAAFVAPDVALLLGAGRGLAPGQLHAARGVALQRRSATPPRPIVLAALWAAGLAGAGPLGRRAGVGRPHRHGPGGGLRDADAQWAPGALSRGAARRSSSRRAGRVLEEGGPDALSMRRLAARVGIRAPLDLPSTWSGQGRAGGRARRRRPARVRRGVRGRDTMAPDDPLAAFGGALPGVRDRPSAPLPAHQRPAPAPRPPAGRDSEARAAAPLLAAVGGDADRARAAWALRPRHGDARAVRIASPRTPTSARRGGPASRRSPGRDGRCEADGSGRERGDRPDHAGSGGRPRRGRPPRCRGRGRRRGGRAGRASRAARATGHAEDDAAPVEPVPGDEAQHEGDDAERRSRGTAARAGGRGRRRRGGFGGAHGLLRVRRMTVERSSRRAGAPPSWRARDRPTWWRGGARARPARGGGRPPPPAMPSLPRMLRTWVSTVRSVSHRRRAMPALVRPSAMSAEHLALARRERRRAGRRAGSRRAPRPPPGRAPSRRRRPGAARRGSRPRRAPGPSAGSRSRPAPPGPGSGASRRAGRAAAPRRPGGRGGCAAAARAPSSSLPGGMRMSAIARSGASAATAASSASASPTAAATSWPASRSSSTRPSRKSAESSPITIRTAAPPRCGCPRRGALERHPAAVGGDPVGQAREAARRLGRGAAAAVVLDAHHRCPSSRRAETLTRDALRRASRRWRAPR